MVKCHQRIVRERMETERPPTLLPDCPDLPVAITDASIRPVDFETARKVILQYEWLGTMPSGFRAAFGIFFDGYCGGVVVYGSPNPMQIAKSVCGGEHVDSVWQIHRGACVWWAHPHSASMLISASLAAVEKLGARIVVAFSDPEAGEVGTVYQATNWLYCGMTAKRPDYYLAGKRLVGNFKTTEYMTKADRPRKHRYTYLLGSKPERKRIRAALAWPVSEYPKRPGHVRLIKP